MPLGRGNQPAVVALDNSTHAKRRFCVGVHGDGLQVRTKVFKCLGAILEADSRIMMMPEVAQAVNAAQEDDSAAVKEAVLELLVKLIGTNPELAGQYFDTLVQASYVSVWPAHSRTVICAQAGLAFRAPCGSSWESMQAITCCMAQCLAAGLHASHCPGCMKASLLCVYHCCRL